MILLPLKLPDSRAEMLPLRMTRAHTHTHTHTHKHTHTHIHTHARTHVDVVVDAVDVAAIASANGGGGAGVVALVPSFCVAIDVFVDAPVDDDDACGVGADFVSATKAG